MNITAQQVKDSALAAKIRQVEHHDCAICGFDVYYRIKEDGTLWFDSTCGGPLTPRAVDEPKKQAATTPALTKAQRAALARLLKLVAPQVGRLAFNANLAERYNAQSAECIAASKERKQLLADEQTLKTVLERNSK